MRYHIFAPLGMQHPTLLAGAVADRADVIICPSARLAVVVLGSRGEHDGAWYGQADWCANNLAPDIMSFLLGSQWVAGATSAGGLLAF